MSRWLPVARKDGRADPQVHALAFYTIVAGESGKVLAYKLDGLKAELLGGFPDKIQAEKACEEAFRASFRKTP